MAEAAFRADGQALSLVSAPSSLVRGTRGYLTARFELSAEWDGCRVAADFGGHAAAVVGGRCDVPDEALRARRVPVRLVGERDGYRITSTTAYIVQREG